MNITKEDYNNFYKKLKVGLKFITIESPGIWEVLLFNKYEIRAKNDIGKERSLCEIIEIGDNNEI